MSVSTAVMGAPALAATAPAGQGERLHALDSLRATAMLLGIVLHGAASLTTIPIPWPVHDVSRSRAFDGMLGAIHGFRMQLFFLLAGFFAHLVWRRMGTRAFLRQRALRIGVPFLAGLFVVMPLVIAVSMWADARTASGFMKSAPANPTLLDFPTGPFWFLEILLVLYAVAMGIAWWGRFAAVEAFLPGLDAAFDALMRTPIKPLLLAIPTFALLWFGPRIPEIDEAGMRLVPRWIAVAYYGLFFAAGWWLHRRVHLMETLDRWLVPYFLLSLGAWLALGLGLRASMLPEYAGHRLAAKALALAGASIYAWSMTFAVTGLFLRVASGHRPWMRYMADASYWWYVVHLPLVIALQAWMFDWPVNGWLKLLLILAIASAALASSYHVLVRYTWIGRILNGPRERPRARIAS
ncbi:acyltransferase family protein [Caenimonas aquaedulcis]|uniref:Acyltransferase family protein n=1 Tax=Caenimonas aquaedulcis TaxID=2793270 RepID=A0A931H3B8_9BURK|nr:acyltransferase family protein [Caenimonas aquaedulcis]MBG9387762.1 acyltransferase family protein [Caenimonas aquaedulcis]